MRNARQELANSSTPIIYTVNEFKNGDGERVQVLIETDADVSGKNLWLLVRRRKYPVPIRNEFDANSSTALRFLEKYGSEQ
jgi:hypothetical protein